MGHLVGDHVPNQVSGRRVDVQIQIELKLIYLSYICVKFRKGSGTEGKDMGYGQSLTVDKDPKRMSKNKK